MRKLFIRDKPKLEEVTSDLTLANSSEAKRDTQGAPITRGLQSGQQDLMRMIGYLTATSSEDWAIVLDVCERASATEANAKEAATALRREFKYGQAPQQLSAARLWAIMLRNSSELFVHQCMKTKFLDTLQDVLEARYTSPVVRDRLLAVLAAAAYASSGTLHKIESSFRVLWRKVKPAGKPDEGVPFDPDDAMFNPPTPSTTLPPGYQFPVQPQSAPPPNTQPQAPVQPLQSPQTQAPLQPNRAKHEAGQFQRVIAPEEDMRRLFQECRIAQENAQLLSEALVLASPEDLREKDIIKQVIKEWYSRCLTSHNLIAAQISWCTTVANLLRLQQQRTTKWPNDNQGSGEEPPVKLRSEELLLGSLVEANEALTSVLRMYDSKELGQPASPRERNSSPKSPNVLPSHPTSANGKPRRVPDKDNGGKSSAEYPAKFTVSDAASSEGEVARLERERLVELERQLSATLAAQTEQDRRMAQLTDELALKSALLEQAQVDAAEATKHTGLEPSELADRLLEKTSLVELKDASLVKMQAKLVELLLSRDQDLRALEQAQSALQKATSRAADADERSRRACERIGHLETELAKVRVAGKSKPEAVSLQLADMDNGWTKNNTDGDTSPPLTTASLDSMDEDPIIRGLVERIRALEAEVAALRWNEKSSDVMNVNEG